MRVFAKSMAGFENVGFVRVYNTAMYCKMNGLWPSRPQQPDDGVIVHHLFAPNNWSREIKTGKRTRKERMRQAVKRSVAEQREMIRIVNKTFNVSQLAAC